MPVSRDESRPSAGLALLAFSGAVFVFHQLPSLAGEAVGDWIDLATPFAVIGAAVLLLGRSAPPLALGVALVSALLYVDGHGIHLSANSIDFQRLTGDARDDAHFWDEEWGHWEWHLGWFVLIAGLCLAEGRRPVTVERRPAALGALLLGWVLFTSTVEGGTWSLDLAATALFVGWALVVRRPLLTAFAAGFALSALLIGIWAIWHGGVPEFSEVDLIE